MGANHAEIGAYLLGIWGLPDAIVEAVAAHHDPGEFPTDGCTTSTAVYVADAFSKDPSVSKIDVEYLTASGVADRLPIWTNLMKSSLGG